MSVRPRDPCEVNHVRLFDAGAVKSRLDELTSAFVNQYAMEEMRKIADKAKRKFQPLPAYNLSLPELYEKYGEQAKKEAQKVLEQERQSYVDYMTDYIKRNLTQIAKQLRFMVWVVDERGRPYKLQRIIEKAMTADTRGKWDFREIQYVGDHDAERLNQISLLSSRLDEFRDYAPYFNEELKQLWETATELATLETIYKEQTKIE